MLEPDARLRLRSVARLARVLAEPRDLLDLLEVAAQEMRFALGAASVSLGRLERDRGIVRTLVNVGDIAAWEQGRPEDETYSVSELPMMAVLIDEAQSYVIDVDDPSAEPLAHQLVVDLGKGSAVAAPILLDGRIWGELWATRHEYEDRFDDSDRELAEALAAVLAAGIGQAEQMTRVERLAYQDALTGLANRRAIDQALEHALDAHRADGRPVAVVMADVNGLKLTNDLEGHEAGDRLILAVANALSRGVGSVPGALAGRIGGDEFCLVLDSADASAAAAVAQHALDALDAGPYAGSLAVGVASTSVVGAASEPVTARRLLRWADEAQYSAKEARLRRPVVAGRDVPLAEPVERRRGRRSQVATATSAEFAIAALDSALRILATAGPEAGSLDRLVASVDAVAEMGGGIGWVVSTIDGPVTRTVAFAASRDGLGVDASLSVGDVPGWLTAARGAGVLCSAGDAALPLADVRGCQRVAAAATRHWVVEVLGDAESPLDAFPAVLRSLVCTAIVG